VTKIISLVKSVAGTDAVEFRRYWGEIFLPSLLALPEVTAKLQRVVHNHVQPGSLREEAQVLPWAGVGEFWYSDRAAADAFLASPGVAQILRGHSGQLPLIVHLHVQEQLMWDRGGKHDAMKAMAFFHPPIGVSREQALRYWNVEHMAVSARLEMDRKLSKYVQNHGLPDYHVADPRYDFIGSPELWFNSTEDAQSLFADEAKVAEMAKDEERFSDRASGAIVIVDEVEMFRA
jgi:uncharacterized protein (TIGR02118 family)